MMRWLNSSPPRPPAPQTAPRSVDELRRHCLALLADCTAPQDERVRSLVTRAATAQQLWLSRCEIYQAVARCHCESEAVRRVNGLLPVFEGWLPASALHPL